MTEIATIAYPILDPSATRPTLFHAICDSSASRLEDHLPFEETVFIDALDRDDAARRLKPLLAML